MKARLKRHAEVIADVKCSTWGLLQGRLDAASLGGTDWQSPLDLTARVLQVGGLSVQVIGLYRYAMCFPISCTRHASDQLPWGTIQFVVFSFCDTSVKQSGVILSRQCVISPEPEH